VDIVRPLDGMASHDQILRPAPKVEVSFIVGAPADDPAKNASATSILSQNPELLSQHPNRHATNHGGQPRLQPPASASASPPPAGSPLLSKNDPSSAAGRTAGVTAVRQQSCVDGPACATAPGHYIAPACEPVLCSMPAVDEISRLIRCGPTTSLTPPTNGKLPSRYPPRASPRITPALLRSASIHTDRWFAIANSSNEATSRNQYRSFSSPDVPALGSGSLGTK
jgi:hypothetical protein